MQNEKQENKPLDDDILQSKADIREAIKALGGLVSGEPVAEQSSQTDVSVPVIEPVEEEDRFLELEKELREKTLALDEQTKRIAFIEKQLQNAVVLERAKSQLQQNILHLNDQNRRLIADNQRLSTEVAQLSGQQKNPDETDSQILRLQKELENAELTLSHERTLTGQANEEIRMCTSEIAEIRKEKEELLSRLQDAVKFGESVHHELTAAQQEIDRLNGRNQELQNQMDDMRQAIPTASPENVPALNEAAVESIDGQSEDGDSIPVFNLAEQIMQEHRRSAASRRQRRETSSGSSQGNSVKHVVQQYVHSAGPAVTASDKRPGDGLHPWIDRSLTPFQQEILREIVRNDVNRYTHKRLNVGGYSSINN